MSSLYSVASSVKECSDKGVLCEVFRSPRKEGMYLYVAKTDGLSRVPEALLKSFGAPQPALSFVLDQARTLANADPQDVRERLQADGYYLQMPKQPDPASERPSEEPRGQLSEGG
ncbi:MAG: YcgL domain-containing protein [Pseudomonadota bacterium]